MVIKNLLVATVLILATLFAFYTTQRPLGLKQAYERQVPVICSVEITDARKAAKIGDNANIDTFYLAGDKLRIESVEAVDKNKSIKTITIIKNNTMWTWKDQQQKGLLSKVPPYSIPSFIQSFAANEGVKTRCAKDNQPPNRFTPPRHVTFSDLPNVIEQFKETIEKD